MHYKGGESMRVETHTETVPIYDIIYDDDGISIIEERYIEDREITITDIYADEGKVFVERSTGKALSEHITLGTEDSAENYSEMPIAEMVME